MAEKELFGISEQLNDTISRQAAIDAMMKLQAEDIEAYGASIPEGFDGDRAVTAIKALPSAQQWISCEERLPEKPGQYYVSGGDKVWICEFLIIATTNIPNFIGGWCNDVANPVVQAWMPLPEPYREDTP